MFVSNPLSHQIKQVGSIVLIYAAPPFQNSKLISKIYLYVTQNSEIFFSGF